MFKNLLAVGKPLAEAAFSVAEPVQSFEGEGVEREGKGGLVLGFRNSNLFEFESSSLERTLDGGTDES